MKTLYLREKEIGVLEIHKNVFTPLYRKTFVFKENVPEEIDLNHLDIDILTKFRRVARSKVEENGNLVFNTYADDYYTEQKYYIDENNVLQLEFQNEVKFLYIELEYTKTTN